MDATPPPNAELSLPNPFALSDPDKTPVPPFHTEDERGLITSARELTPITTAFAAAPKSRPAPPPRIVEPTTPDPPTPALPAAGLEPASSNPFLARPPAPAAQPQAAQRVPSAPQPQVAPIVGRPGAESPHIADPHAAFRKGNVLKRLLLVAVVAVVGGGLFFLLPGGPTEQPRAESKDPRRNAVIGSSVSPDIIVDPRDVPLEERKRLTSPPSHAESAPAPASKSADNDGFASAFKSQAN